MLHNLFVGFFRGREGGCGGGGAFVEAIVDLEPFTILEITVGAGGQGGVCGTAIQAVPIDEQRRLMGMKRELEKKLPVGTNLPVEEDMTRVDVIDGNCGVALGGQPGGGEGYGGGSCWASGKKIEDKVMII